MQRRCRRPSPLHLEVWACTVIGPWSIALFSPEPAYWPCWVRRQDSECRVMNADVYGCAGMLSFLRRGGGDSSDPDLNGRHAAALDEMDRFAMMSLANVSIVQQCGLWHVDPGTQGATCTYCTDVRCNTIVGSTRVRVGQIMVRAARWCWQPCLGACTGSVQQHIVQQHTMLQHTWHVRHSADDAVTGAESNHQSFSRRAVAAANAVGRTFGDRVGQRPPGEPPATAPRPPPPEGMEPHSQLESQAHHRRSASAPTSERAMVSYLACSRPPAEWCRAATSYCADLAGQQGISTRGHHMPLLPRVLRAATPPNACFAADIIVRFASQCLPVVRKRFLLGRVLCDRALVERSADISSHLACNVHAICSLLLMWSLVTSICHAIARARLISDT